MAPEQARGMAADRRADIWAFGVVLLEMLSGRPVFQGQTIADTIANILQREPDWNALPADTPAALRKLVKRCLTKAGLVPHLERAVLSRGAEHHERPLYERSGLRPRTASDRVRATAID
jgi:serine/threonine protein kinase